VKFSNYLKEPVVFLDKLIFSFYALLFFFVPLVLSPWTSELFEFNKMILVYLFTVIIIFAWILKIIFSGKIFFRKTFWDIPLLFFLFFQIVSTLFSIDRHTSIFGYYSRFNGGLLSTICYLFLYWACVSNLNKKQRLSAVRYSLFAGLLVSLYGIAEHFGIDKHIWIQDVQARVFSTLGQPNWLAAYLNILLFLTLPFLAFSNKKSKSIIYYLLFIIYYICFLFTKSRSGFLGFIVPFLFFIGTAVFFAGKKDDRKLLYKVLSLLAVFVSLSVLIGTPVTNSSFLGGLENEELETVAVKAGEEKQPLVTPSSNIRKIVWKGAFNIWKKRPIFGTGPETFAYSYYWVRPKEHNLTSEWDFLYNKAHNEYLNVLATTGLFGLLSYLFLHVSLAVWTFKSIKYQGSSIEDTNKKSKIFNIQYSISLFLINISLFVTNFFGFSVVTTTLLFFLLPAAVTESKRYKIIELKKFSENKKVFIFIALLLTSYLILHTFRYWLADFYYTKGVGFQKANLLAPSIDNLDKAITLNKNEPNFYSERSISLAKLTAALASSDEASISAEILQKAIADSEKAIRISPYHLNFYKNQAKVFYYLAFYDTDFLRRALDTLFKAEKLAPTDPKITYNIASIYQLLGDKIREKEYFEKTVGLKPNYEVAKEGLEEVSGEK